MPDSKSHYYQIFLQPFLYKIQKLYLVQNVIEIIELLRFVCLFFILLSDLIFFVNYDNVEEMVKKMTFF